MTTTSAPTHPITDFGVVDPRAAWICSIALLFAPVRACDYETAFSVLRHPLAVRRLSIWRLSWAMGPTPTERVIAAVERRAELEAKPRPSATLPAEPVWPGLEYSLALVDELPAFSQHLARVRAFTEATEVLQHLCDQQPEPNRTALQLVVRSLAAELCWRVGKPIDVVGGEES